MNERIARASAWFVAPAPAQARRGSAAPPDLVGVLASAADIDSVAGGVAAELRRRHRSRAAVVCRPGPAVQGPALRAAHALTRRLRDQGLRASARGALCLAELTDGSARVMWRAAAVGVPVVVAVPARDPEIDELLAQTDLLLVAGPTGAYAELALASLATLGPPAAAISPPAGFAGRRAAALGLARLPLDPQEVPA